MSTSGPGHGHHGCPIPNRLRAHEAQGDEANLLRITADPWEKQWIFLCLVRTDPNSHKQPIL